MGKISLQTLDLGKPVSKGMCPAAEGVPEVLKPLAPSTMTAVNAVTWWQTAPQQMLSALSLDETSCSEAEIGTIQMVNLVTMTVTLNSNQEMLRAKFLQAVHMKNIVIFGKNA